jgi:copper oxidase (laccase) domain-containing protein
VDLRAILADQARTLGIANISISSFCTAHDRDRFFSHRASGGQDGRLVAYVGLPRRVTSA